MTRRRLTIRARLTLLWGGLFLAAGTILLALTWFLVRESLKDRVGVQFKGEAKEVPTLAPGVGGVPPDADTAGVADEARKYFLAEANKFESDTLNSILIYGGVALAIVALVGMVFGWLMAERALRPLARITETARRVAGRSLHERIALDGPSDEIKELADTFDSMLERLDRAFDSQRMFVGNASHELRTPLAINRTLIEVALGRPDMPAEVRVLGDALLAVNGRQERLLDGLLTLAQSEQELTVWERVDLSEVADHVLDQTPLNNLTLHRSLAPAPAMGDPVLLERIVQNLVQNAVAYNVEHGWVEVRTEHRPNAVDITVSNTGPVVPPYDVPALFEPFRRLRDRVGSAKGTGLGLSIVRSVAHAHGGSATAAPREGGGLVVHVTLPVAMAVASVTVKS
ncbi:sensor histidine kinase [Virgisporangium aurantiacum]|uniref:histidine kinase n=1 Tax=Virgisporangium aurantiacum TaxID=175570 RepID=A0A8J4E5G6_9ACTN|nr:HAMP domain-containing sensor histidine kinase [Virgisporangium aurantiacum]GIJ59892.1 sensor protein CutS [Virgisporangium aurantiacum]